MKRRLRRMAAPCLRARSRSAVVALGRPLTNTATDRLSRRSWSASHTLLSRVARASTKSKQPRSLPFEFSVHSRSRSLAASVQLRIQEVTASSSLKVASDASASLVSPDVELGVEGAPLSAPSRPRAAPRPRAPLQPKPAAACGCETAPPRLRRANAYSCPGSAPDGRLTFRRLASGASAWRSGSAQRSRRLLQRLSGAAGRPYNDTL